ncbi:MAG TPA: S41 family peptidase [Blastocatellia bacterium]|nr:S41 family peptidase [Blastocatellia bacterium]
MPEQEEEIGARARLKEAEDAVRSQPAAAMRLSTFLRAFERKGKLSRKDRLRIVEQSLLLLNMNYVHLPLKRAMHAVDPIQRLKLLRFRLLEMKESEMPSEMRFHQRMMEIFASTRDLHTMYLLPAPFKDHVAYLPFLIEQYFERNGKTARVEKFTVSRVVKEFYQSIPNAGPEVLSFEAGVEVLYWNGVPIRRAIELNGESQAGSNIDARFARGLDNLTIRPLETSLPPDEIWVNVTYRSRTGKIFTLNQEWLVHGPGAAGTPALASKSTRKKRAAIDIKKTKINQLRKTLFVPRSVPVRKSLQHILYAETRTVDGREFGYIRLFSFDVDDPDEFVRDFARVIKSDGFPQEGLIIDVRGNGGGKIRAGERLLQLFTPRRIKPELFEFLNTPLNLDVCRLAPKSWQLDQWAESIAESVVTGSTYSSGFPLNSEESCNDIGQTYYGPVVLITDALSYSTTDMFAAGFQDNEIGEILGTSDNTGAGGANVWWYQDLVNAVSDSPHSPFKPLPKGADILLAVRRSIRVGRHAGRPLEELGIIPDQRHHMTKRDVLNSNEDLVARAAKILAKKPVYALSVKPFTPKKGARGIIVTAVSKILSSDSDKKISRLDVYLGGRPYKSFDARDGAIQARRITLGRSGGRKAELLLEARDSANNLVAVCRRAR